MRIERLMIANRGEITVRIADTAAALGIGTVGVYSDPDRNAAHVDAVDLAVALGGSSPSESYLRADAIVAAALDTGCDAVHPGYGFLAENAGFAQAVIDAGLVWVGPTPDQIRLLGDKVAAKRAAAEAGVPTTDIVTVAPGAVPDGIAMPALVKAAAGGGGRGMRVVRDPADLDEAVEAASREAESAFGDGTVFVEPFIERGRHVEVQILGDAHGNVVHLHERDCSIQRRNQKIVEEAPSPGITPAVRARLHEGAVRLARHVGYENAGTVEFLVGGDGDDATITFLEVNTRLQVEHPVTEAITGLDLVELQLRVAAGEPLPIDQDAVGPPRGHAIEVRLVAEDPAAGWQPSTGLVTGFAFPSRRGHVRVDAGVAVGNDVSPHYDSLLAKLIGHGADRSQAVRRLATTLARGGVDGVATNRSSLVAILRHDAFRLGPVTTAFLDDHPEVLTGGVTDRERIDLLVAASLGLEHRRRRDAPVAGFAPSGWRNLRTSGQRRAFVADGVTDHVEYVRRGDESDVLVGPWPQPGPDGSLSADGRLGVRVRHLGAAADEITLEIDGRRQRFALEVRSPAPERTVVHVRGATAAVTFDEVPRFVDHDDELAGAGPVSPLPGTVIAVHVAPGDEVAEGQVLLVVEAMKMEHRITAGVLATVDVVHFAPGDRVAAGDLLVSLTPLTA